jgi:3'(2'), 5'-bisphosphate nucleotidase
MKIKSQIDFTYLSEVAKNAAIAGGEAIMNVYTSEDFGIEQKADNSPLTIADQNAHMAIIDVLKSTKIPVLSEEGKNISFEVRKKWSIFWMVDPLDGTKEFIKRNGEFTVNIALIKNDKPVLGVVFTPVLDKLFFGGSALGGAWMVNGSKEKKLLASEELSLNKLKFKDGVRIVASRSHRNADTDTFIRECESAQIVSMGSSLKFLVVAEGNADIYPRFAPTMEWDTAAADGVLRGLGYNVLQVVDNNPTLIPLEYNKQNLLNPHFIVY